MNPTTASAITAIQAAWAQRLRKGPKLTSVAGGFSHKQTK